MRSLSLFAFLALAIMVNACTDTPTSTVNTTLGETTIEAIKANTGYVWYQTGYDAYPDANSQTAFQQQVDLIKANLDTANHSVIMVIKPTCSCQKTQIYFPQAMKALDAAGFPHDRIKIYITDARMAGIDDIKTKYNVSAAPTFIVLKNDVDKGRLVEDPATGKSVEQTLADAFAQP
jgi:hypothetical protein